MIIFNNQQLKDDKKSLSSYGLKDGDLVALQHLSPAARGRREFLGISMFRIIIYSIVAHFSAAGQSMDFSGISVPPAGRSGGQSASPNDPAMIRDMLLANPDQLAMLRQNNPELAEAVMSGSLGELI